MKDKEKTDSTDCSVEKESPRSFISLRVKLFIILSFVITFSACLNYAIQRMVIFPSFVALEKEEAEKNMERCVQALQREIEHLDTYVNDWSAWDDTYRFVQDGNAEYIEINLVFSAFTINRTNLIYVVNTKNEVVWGKIYDLETEEEIMVKDFPSDVFPQKHPLLAHKELDSSVAGIMLTEAGPMLIASRPILTSNEEGPIKGSMIMGRFVDDETVETISEQTRVDLELWVAKEEALPPEERKFLREVGPANPFVITDLDDRSLEVHTLFPDIEGAPALLMHAQIPRDITARGAGATRYAMISTVVAGLIVLFALLALLRMTVVDPIGKLTRHAIAVGETDDLSTKFPVERRDEIGVMAKEFNRMMEHLAETRQRLLDQSYYSGMAEIASGVLHNIRNVLSPMVGHLESVSEILRKDPIEKVEMAQRELVETEPTDDREKDLIQYLEAATRHIVNSRKEMTSELEAVLMETKHIEEILAEQDSLSRAERVILPMNLGVLVEESLSLLSSRISQGISIDMDPEVSTVGPVLAQRISLVQVFNNLITNAAESILSAGVEDGRININAVAEQSNGAPMVHIKIQDNGTGIEEKNVKRIFERGFSSKERSSSGLGLHWCANTVAAMNGEIFAESLGKGKGATIHLLLPMKP